MTTPAPKLRWYQYGLRALLAFLMLCAVPCGWFALKMQQAMRQRAAVAEIKEMGGAVVYDREDDGRHKSRSNAEPPGPTWMHRLLGDDFFQQVHSVCLTNPMLAEGAQVTDASLEHLKVLTQLQCLELDQTQVTDAGLEQLQGLSQLHTLLLRDTKITDVGLKHLSRLKQLQILFLAGTEVTDAGLETLGGLSKLQYLGLGRTRVTDAGLAHLKGLNQLQWLFLYETNVTDVGLEHLQGLTKLKKLDLYGTPVTDEGVNKLQRALPNCKITK